LFINGQRFCSLGTNRHQDHPFVGYAMPDSAQWRDVKKLREAGFTSVRSHYPQSPAFMDACDELGMLVIVSNPGWQFVGDEIFQQRAIQNARTMVRRDRNRPSVILWEAALNESNNSNLAAALQAAVHEEFPGDQCFTAAIASARSRRAASRGTSNISTTTATVRTGFVSGGSGRQLERPAIELPRRARMGEAPMLSQAHSHVARMNDIWFLITEPTVVRTRHVLRAPVCGPASITSGAITISRFMAGPLDLFRLPKFGHYFSKASDRRTFVYPVWTRADGVIAQLRSFLSPITITVFSTASKCDCCKMGKRDCGAEAGCGSSNAHPPVHRLWSSTWWAGQSTMYMTGVADVGTRSEN